MSMMTETERILSIIRENAPMSMSQIIGEEIREFINSDAYRMAVKADEYFRNRSSVQDKQVRYSRRSNTKDEHPILRKLVNQKTNYLLTKPFSVDCEDKTYATALNGIFDNRFRKVVKSFGRGAPKSGIGWAQPYIDEKGLLRICAHPYISVIPLWTDEARTEPGGFIHFFNQTVYIGTRKTSVIRAELWDQDGVQYFVKEEHGDWKEDPEQPGKNPHFYLNGEPYVWGEVPLIWVRYNEEELPLYYFLKDLIDALNWNSSITDDVLRDVANFIYILKGYGGTDMNQFVKELHEALAIRLQNDGGLDKLQADLNIDAVMKFLDDTRRKIFDFGDGVDTKDPDLGNASGRAIAFRYMDLDNDCQNLAMELQESFERLKYFLDQFFIITGQGDFTEKTFTITFNMDMPVNEVEVIDNIGKLAGGRTVASQRTLIGQLPFVDDVEAELAQIEREEAEAAKRQEEHLKLYSFPDGAEGDDTG